MDENQRQEEFIPGAENSLLLTDELANQRAKLRQRVGSQLFETDKLERGGMGCLKVHRRGDPGFQRLLPTSDTQAPAGTRLKPGKPGLRRNEIIAASEGEFEKLFCHAGTNRMQPDVARAGAAVTIPV